MTFKNNLSYNIVAFVIILLSIWSPLQVWILKIDGASRIPAFFCFIALFIVLCSKKRIWTKPVKVYLLLLIYILINGYSKGGHILHYSGLPNWQMFWVLFKTFGYYLIIQYALSIYYKHTIKLLTYSLIIYCFICLIFSGFSVDRTELAINANEIAINASLTYGLVILNSVYNPQVRLKTIVLALVPFLTVLMTASRMGFAIIVLITMLFIIGRNKTKSVRAKFLSIILCLIVGFCFNLIMDNSEVGERYESTLSTTEEHEDLQTGTVLDYLGDRGFQYYTSWNLFCDNPITGIGFMSWAQYNPTGHICHSEYLFQYLENGLIGFILYCIFLVLTYRQYKRKPNEDGDKSILLALFISILFANVVLWTYSSFAVFAVFAILSHLPKLNKRVTI